MKNQTSNGSVSHFDAIRSMEEEEIPEVWKEERKAGKSRKNKSKRKKNLMFKCRIKWRP